MAPRLLTLAPILAILAAFAAPAEARQIAIGINANTVGWGTSVGAKQDEVLRTGARWIREELWPAQDRAQQDRLFRAAALRGMRVLPLVSASDNVLPEDPAGYAAWTAHLTGRYGPGGRFWQENPDLDARLAPSHFEIWNEPYLIYSTGRVDPARYASVYIAAVQAGRAANPAARFLVAAATDVKRFDGVWVNWTDAMFQARPDLGAYVDAVAVHLYHRGDPGQPMGAYIHDKFRRGEHIRDRFAANGVAAQFWITEIGYSNCSNPDWCVTEAQAAARMRDVLAIAADEWTFVDAVFMYHLWSWPGAAEDKEASFGLLRADGTPKPAYVTFAEAVARWGAPVYENAPQVAISASWKLSKKVRERALTAAPPGTRARAAATKRAKRATTKRKRVCRTVRRGGRRVRVCTIKRVRVAKRVRSTKRVRVSRKNTRSTSARSATTRR